MPTCLSNRRDGFDSRTGRFPSGRSRAERQPSDTRSKAGSTPAGPTVIVSWSSGVLATPTRWRSLVQIQPGLLPLPWPSGDGTSLTPRGSQVRVLPGVLVGVPVAQRTQHHASNVGIAGSSPAGDILCGVDWRGCQHGLISRNTWVQIPPPQLMAGYANGHSGQVESLVSVGSTPTSATATGLLVEEEDAAVARRKSGCDSPAVHWHRG